ncbi:Transcriptional regulator containing PAS, AAA-type ATPase, and DNA-binding Fis domains [Paenibacillus sp. 1_12]|uniref:sigma-54-dependent transcriptional regulator n=1 Tax=Paenibacillus sp. 1_12 TaxID=1566278 RepID=UPI0008E04E77|nr:sigma-54-dependent transcriptional regulator [Paenibacillus sp. 1_12]SFK95503.1 Transcriptional regulator containing PAS, AAA-type ATPase, and DNA-binding Fis domains [Paenibacillus sp. 1_12]
MLKFLLIAPYRGMKDLLEDIPAAPGYEVHAEVGDLQQGVSIAGTAEQQGYDVIISRGGTAQLIRSQVSIPVIEITVNGYDILRSLTLVKGYRGTIGIIGFPNIVDGVGTIAELLDIQVMTFIIHHEHEAEAAVNKAKELGVDLVIGDVVTVAVAEHSGVRAILITSGREALQESLLQAEQTVKRREAETRQIVLMKSIFDSLKQGIVCVDSGQNVILCNEQAGYQLGVTVPIAANTKWHELIAGISTPIMAYADASRTEDRAEGAVRLDRTAVRNRSDPFQVQESDPQENLILVIEHSLAEHGTIYELHNSRSIEGLERRARRIREDRLSPPKCRFQQFVQTDYMNEAYMDKAKRWSKQLYPILIIGEPGTGKKTLAQALHNDSPYQSGPFVLFDAGTYAIDQQDQQLFGRLDQEGTCLLRRAESGTLHIHRIEQLSLPVQRKLAATLQASHAALINEDRPPFRFIASTSADLAHKVNQGEFDMQLLVQLQIYSLHLPPLRSVLADLDHIVFWYLAEMNRALGSQVLGIKPDALNRMTTYEWPGNFAELQQVLKLIVETCEGSFITLQQLQPVMDSLISKLGSATNDSLAQLIGTTRTLEEIEGDIIRFVLEQEGFNQSATAKRLGMNRTTLWRKLSQ